MPARFQRHNDLGPLDQLGGELDRLMIGAVGVEFLQ
jgi:hypothetical protein